MKQVAIGVGILFLVVALVPLVIAIRRRMNR
jgi:hypothetical protein